MRAPGPQTGRGEGPVEGLVDGAAEVAGGVVAVIGPVHAALEPVFQGIFRLDAEGFLFVEAEDHLAGCVVGQVCYRNAVPFTILRCISDDFNNNEFMDFMQFREIAAKRSIKAIEEFIKNA